MKIKRLGCGHAFGWNRWNRAWFYGTLGLHKDYGVRYCRA